MFKNFLYYLAICSIATGFFLSYLVVLTFTNPVLMPIFGNNWDVLTFCWAFSLGLLALGFAIFLYNIDDKKTKKIVFNSSFKYLLLGSLVYLFLTFFVGFGVIFTNSYSISFAHTYKYAYVLIWIASLFFALKTFLSARS